ncbi:MAG: voltage-gated potassium channel [Desulfovibrionales bacterium]|jgi:voltage-gated potassium channel|nr:voltage-gated potassium channel [Desulfovibrionales bacterium]
MTTQRTRKNGLTLRQRFSALRRKYDYCYSLLIGAAILTAIFTTGVVGYIVLEGYGFVDSLYMVVITLSTVGFMEVKPLSESGRIFTSVLILSGVGAFAYLVGAFSQVLVEGRLQAIFGRRRMEKTINKLEGHFIICGYGRIGSVVADEITKEGYPVVIIEQSPELIETLQDRGMLCLQGDATDDHLLQQAGLGRARALITALTDEAANVYVTLTVRQLNPHLTIIARANRASHVARLEMAGATRVVMPHLIGGVRMAQTVLRPTVTNFLELALRGQEGMDLQLEELTVSLSSELDGVDLKNSQIRPRFNLIVVAIKKYSGAMIFNPGPNEVLEANDTLLAVGRSEDFKRLEEIL